LPSTGRNILPIMDMNLLRVLFCYARYASTCRPPNYYGSPRPSVVPLSYPRPVSFHRPYESGIAFLVSVETASVDVTGLHLSRTILLMIRAPWYRRPRTGEQRREQAVVHSTSRSENHLERLPALAGLELDGVRGIVLGGYPTQKRSLVL
jgi:hypothetical protein